MCEECVCVLWLCECDVCKASVRCEWVMCEVCVDDIGGLLKAFWYTNTRVLHTCALTQHMGKMTLGQQGPFCSKAGAIIMICCRSWRLV